MSDALTDNLPIEETQVENVVLEEVPEMVEPEIAEEPVLPEVE